MKIPVMSIDFIKFKLISDRRILIIASLFLALTIFPLTVLATDVPVKSSSRKVIVLDPGHGGHETGAIGSEGVSEKNIVMAFSRIVTQKLKNRYQVLLTRKDDYGIDIQDRIALANQNRADLFISIHTGGSALRNPSGVSLFYYEMPSPMKSPLGMDSYDSAEDTQHLAAWDGQPPELKEKSKYFAELIKSRLLESDQNLKIVIEGAPMLVINGADMPALLIEIGYVTNPTELKMLQDQEVMSNYAQSISRAIDDFFSDDLRL